MLNPKFSGCLCENISRVLWQSIREECVAMSQQEPLLASFYHSAILSHRDMLSATSCQLAHKLACNTMPATLIRHSCERAMMLDPSIGEALSLDLNSYRERDPACQNFSMVFLYFKGFQALQAYRVAHWLWRHEQQQMALFFQSQVSRLFEVDIHPAARIGAGIMIDHATGLVIGENVSVGNHVSILHGVTLGKGGTDPSLHTSIGNNVVLSAGACVFGKLEVGDGAIIGAGSLVVDSVPANTVVAGVPAKVRRTK